MEYRKWGDGMLKKIFALSDTGAKNLKAGIIATAISNLCLMAPISVLMLLILDLLNGKNIDPVKFMGGAILFFSLIFISQWIQYDKTYTAAYEECANRRVVLAEKLRRLPLSFFGQKNLADLTTTIMGDCTALERVISNAIPQIFGTIFMFLFTAIGLTVIDARMGFCILIPVPVAAFIVFAARKSQEKADRVNVETKRVAYDGVQEFLENIQEIKSNAREETYLRRLDEKLEHVVASSFQNELAPGVAVSISQLVLRFGLVIVLLVGSIFVTQGTLSIPILLLFLLFAGRIYDPFSSCFMLLAEVFSALVSIKRMREMENTKEQTGSSECRTDGYDITFSNVSFSYNEEKVLNNVSFTAKQGEVTALVGPSGSGKSTISKLAARFWDADTGKVCIGGRDVTTVEPEALLEKFAIVFQDVTLFDNTIMENIRLGKKGATDDEVIAAAKAAQCQEFIDRMPNGYQTNIGENGCALSGGERQRISIARAILKDAPIVLLDEATASMDAESETLVQKALGQLLQNKTVLVIAHRMRTIAKANKVVVLDGGSVQEKGRPEELLEKKGLFYRLVYMQE